MREFKLINATGAAFDLMRTDAFFHAPEGLGVANDLSISRVGDSYLVTDSRDAQPKPSGEMVFKGYAQYDEFLAFCRVGGLVLGYKPLDTWLYLDCWADISKGEISRDNNRLVCGVSFTGVSNWYAKAVEYKANVDTGVGKVYGYHEDTAACSAASALTLDAAKANGITALRVNGLITQAGTGTATPANVRAISGVAASATVGGTAYSVSTGALYTGDYADLVSGAVHRAGAVVDLGTLTWTAANGKFLAKASANPVLAAGAVPSSLTVPSGAVCSALSCVPWSVVNGGTVNYTVAFYGGSSGGVFACDTDCATADAFRAAMSGVWLWFPLATATDTAGTGNAIINAAGDVTISAGGAMNVTYTRARYGYQYSYTYSSSETGTIAVDGIVVPSYCRVHIFGPCTNPVWSLYQNDALVAKGKCNVTIPAGYKLVIDSDPASMELAEYTSGNVFASDEYQNSDFSTARFITLPSGDSKFYFSQDDEAILSAYVEVKKRV